MFVSFFKIAVNRLFRLRQRRVVAVMNNSSRHAAIHTICRHLTISFLVAAAFIRNIISLDSFPIRSDRHCPFAAHSRSSISSARFQPKPFSMKRLPRRAGIHVKSLLRGPMSALSIRVRFHGEAQKTQAVYTEGAKATGGATCCSKLVHLQGGPTRGSRHLGASGFTGGVMKMTRRHECGT